MTEQTTPRFGSASFGSPTAALMSGIPLAPPAPAPVIAAPETKTDQSAKPRTRKPREAQPTPANASTRIWVGVPTDVHENAVSVARSLHRTLGDLVILGTQLELSYGLADDTPVPADLPLSKARPTTTGLVTLQVRLSAKQSEWLTNKAREAGATSMRQYAGAALTAYVRSHMS